MLRRNAKVDQLGPFFAHYRNLEAYSHLISIYFQKIRAGYTGSPPGGPVYIYPCAIPPGIVFYPGFYFRLHRFGIRVFPVWAVGQIREFPWWYAVDWGLLCHQNNLIHCVYEKK